jgi:hypothetical protein
MNADGARHLRQARDRLFDVGRSSIIRSASSSMMMTM